MRILFLVPLVLMAGAQSFGLAPEADPVFEVATVKPSDPNSEYIFFKGMTANNGMVRLTNISLQDAVRVAYRLRDFQVEGDAWIRTARYEITARLPEGSSSEQIPEMLRTLLTERFHLTVRHEQKPHSVLALLAGRSGPKLKPAAPGPPEPNAPTALGPDGRPRPVILLQFPAGGIRIVAHAVTIPSLVDLMSRFTELPVVDLTGLDGTYDVNFAFAADTSRYFNGNPVSSDAAAGEPVPSVFDAVLALGLRVERRKMPLDTLVVVTADKTPVEN